MYQCFALAFSYICLSDWISIVNGLFTVVYCVYIVLLNFLKFLLKSAEPTHPQAGTKTIDNFFAYRVTARTNPSPSGDENRLSGNNFKLSREPTHPQAGTKTCLFRYFEVIETEPTHPQAGTKINVDLSNPVAPSRTNPSPLGDENFFNTPLSLFYKLMNQPIPKRGRKRFRHGSSNQPIQNQPIPKRGRKLRLKVFTFDIQKEPTHPQAGTKIFRSSTSGKSIRKQPIPTRGRKFFSQCVCCSGFKNQPIPKRGRKHRLFGIIHFKVWEPTHPHSGTKIFRADNLFQNNSTNQPIPTRGRKLNIGKTDDFVIKNQPVPTRGRK